MFRAKNLATTSRRGEWMGFDHSHILKSLLKHNAKDYMQTCGILDQKK
jgi:hypothetical protein